MTKRESADNVPPGAAAGKRRRIAMLAAHEPRDDPRVAWAAELAAKYFDVLVVGLRTRPALAPVEERRKTYRVVRCEPVARPTRAFLVNLLSHGSHFAGTSMHAWSKRAIGVLLLLLLVPAVLAAAVIEIGIRLAWLVAPLVPKFTLRLVTGTGGERLRAWYLRWAEVEFLRKWRMFKWTWVHVLGSAEAFGAFLETCEDRFDVVYCHDLDSLLAGVLYRARNNAVRLIYDSHEYWPHSNVEALTLHVHVFTWYERFLIRRADHVLTVSEPLARELERVYGIDEVVVVPNAEWWSEPTPTLREGNDIQRLADGRVSFLFQGSFAPERGLEELIRAWQGVNPESAALFLRGPENASRQALVELARANGLLDRTVYFLDAVDVDDLVGAAGEADVGVIPYKADLPAYKFACPNKLSQYLHAGVAVLSNDIAYVRSVLEAGKCGTVYDVTKPASIVRAVEELAGSREKLAGLKRNASEYGRDVFNWQVQSRDLDLILGSLTGPDHRAA